MWRGNSHIRCSSLSIPHSKFRFTPFKHVYYKAAPLKNTTVAANKQRRLDSGTHTHSVAFTPLMGGELCIKGGQVGTSTGKKRIADKLTWSTIRFVFGCMGRPGEPLSSPMQQGIAIENFVAQFSRDGVCSVCEVICV